MFDIPDPAPPMQRARGDAAVALSSVRGGTRLARLRQAGCAKALLPRGPGAPEVVFLNTSGGITGGDRLDYALTVGVGAEATATTQAAERVYRASERASPAEVRVRMEVGDGARLDWLPQETILFDGGRLDRDTEVALAGDARLLMCEALVLGRAAMGEDVRRLDLIDRRAVTRDGRPVLVDAVALDDAAISAGRVAAGLAGSRAVAILALVAPGAEDAAAVLRGLPCVDGVRRAVSGWDGRCLVRLAAADAWPLRLALATLIRHLRSTRGAATPLPRVWQI